MEKLKEINPCSYMVIILIALSTASCCIQKVASSNFEELKQVVLEANIESMEVQIRNGSDITKLDEQNNNLLHIACRRQNFSDKNAQYKIVKYLLERGVDPNQVNNAGFIPAQYAVLDSSILLLLLKNGSSVNCTQCNATLVEQAVHHINIPKGNLKMIIDYGGCRTQDCDKFLLSALKLKTECFKLILDEVDRLDFIYFNSWTILHFSVDQGEYTKTKLLLNKGGDIELKSKEEYFSLESEKKYPIGISPYAMALNSGNRLMIELFEQN